ncbi:SulP family inorganic anion transporter [Dysgonomonas sp. 520]|uniref:SulP family inorganic anion transporter n=1 Tax=Dysgonomonas sp. 520 TaxID=2302931 RepID=UPI0013D029E9|nr:sulfate permease [Dysgonomonas sp. 520]NDW10245.1 sulfate permease [Dysgonomonas sp. 520]
MKLKLDIKNSFKPQLFSSLKTYNKEKFMKDLMAGLIVGIVALPLAIAFGIASGVSPEKGIYTSIIAGFIISFLGGSSVQIGGPTGAFIVIVSNILAQYGTSGLIITTIMAGIILILMGVLRLGIVIKFIPYPILVGYMSGIAVIIFSTQVKDFFGLQIGTIPADFLSQWKLYIANFTTLDITTTIVGILSLLIIIFSHKISKKIPGSLLAIVIVTILVVILRNSCDITSVQTIGDKFDISSNLPTVEKFSFNIELINVLFPTAFTLAILCAIESLVSASVAEGVTGDKSHSNTELIAQGIANIITPIFGGIPATGALARTMTNVSNGGRTPVAGIIHSIFLLLVVLFLGGLTKHIPMVCLAAILVVVSYNMSEWRSFVALMRNSTADIIVLVTTFLLTVIFGLTMAIQVGIVLAIFLFMKRVTESTQVLVSKDVLNVSDKSSAKYKDKVELPKGVEVYEIDGPFFFGIANKFEESMRVISGKPKIRIIRMRKVPFMDSTGLHNLESLCMKAKKEEIHIILSGVNEEVRESLEKAKFPALIGVENICPNIDAALERANVLLNEWQNTDN